MTVVEIVDNITEWTNKNICSQIKLKRAAADREPSDEGYNYELVTPVAFSLFVPTKEKLPPEIKTSIPSVCVRITEGKDNYSIRELQIELAFSTWNTGRHNEDIIYPDNVLAEKESFIRNGEGWRDLWNFMEIALRQLEINAAINDIEIVKDKPVMFGPYKQQETIPDFYPFWFGYVSFFVKTGLSGYVKDYNNFL